MKLTWEEMEAHRNEVTALQWQRLRAYFQEGKTLTEIGGAGRKGHAKTSVNLSIGRGCMVILNAMLGNPQSRTGNEIGTAKPSRPRQQAGHPNGKMRSLPLHTSETVTSSVPVQSSPDHPSTAMAEGLAMTTEAPEGSSFHPFAGLADLLKISTEDAPDQQHHESAPHEDPSLTSSEFSTSKRFEFAPHMRVEGTHKGGHDLGKVEKIAGTVAVVVWDSGFKTLTPLANLTPLGP